ncbi:fimbrial protein [Escherichia coli]|uniref:fimbrial protein n=1 Tax=Escherichia coli TaxID=562 RepID=UPI0038B3A8A9
MLNIIHHLKYSVFLSVTGAFMVGHALAEPLDIPAGHWQANMAVGETVFGGSLYVTHVPWQWQPQSVQVNSHNIRTELAGNDRILMATRPGQEFYILKGHMTLLACPSPELQPSISLLQPEQTGEHMEVRGELEHGQVRYGEITFKVNHVLAWQDSFSAEKGWSRASGVITPEIEKQVSRQLWQVDNYEWSPVFSGHSVSPDVFISDENIVSSVSDRPKIAGGWVTSLTDIRVNFTGMEEPVKYWQGHLTAVVKYF